MDENGKKNIKSNNKKIIILFMLIPIILIVEVLCFTGYRNYVSKRNADNNSKESYNEKKENIKKDKKDTNDTSKNTNDSLNNNSNTNIDNNINDNRKIRGGQPPFEYLTKYDDTDDGDDANFKVSKIDSSKDYIYDANYIPNVRSKTYADYDSTIRNIDNYKAPYINLNSSYAKKVNDNIKKVYDQAAQVFDFSIDHNSCIGIEIFEYKHYLVGDMLAVVLTTKYRTCAVTIPKYYIYVINVKTGRKVNLDEILEYKNINKDDFNEKVKNGIINSYYSSFDDSKDYDYLVDENLKTYENDTNKKFFIDDNGKINLLISITIRPGEIEEIFKIITIE